MAGATTGLGCGTHTTSRTVTLTCTGLGWSGENQTQVHSLHLLHITIGLMWSGLEWSREGPGTSPLHPPTPHHHQDYRLDVEWSGMEWRGTKAILHSLHLFSFLFSFFFFPFSFFSFTQASSVTTLYYLFFFALPYQTNNLIVTSEA